MVVFTMANNACKECRRQFILDLKNTIAQERINRQYWKKYHVAWLYTLNVGRDSYVGR